MAEYIEKNKAIKELYEVYDYEFPTASGSFDEYARMIVPNTIKNMPTADVAPVVHGRWETNSDRPDSLICSICKCGFDMWKHDPHNYCPNCGAKMDEEIET